MPFRGRDVTECCVPLFHSLGVSHEMYAMALGSTLVLRRHFDPARALESVAAHGASAMIVVPIMLRRILDLGPEALAEHDLSALRIVFVGGSQLGAALTARALEGLGPVVYTMYGSTEVAYATIATPADLAAEPGCVGTVAPGSVVRVYTDDLREAPPGTPGRIFVGNVPAFEGYTGGGWPASRCRATWSSSTRYPATRAARCSSGSSTTTSLGPDPRRRMCRRGRGRIHRLAGKLGAGAADQSSR